MTTPEFSPLELLAYTMYQLSQETKGKVSARWWCMDEELRASYMEKATKTYESWAAAERAVHAKNSSVMEVEDRHGLDDEQWERREDFEKNCSCHINPPCGNCIEHSELFPEEM